jgi:hypothetical protein
MKKLLLLLLLLPGICLAQFSAKDGLEKTQYLQEDFVDATTGDTIKRTHWLVLQRGSVERKLNIYFRISSVNHSYIIDLKVIQGASTFAVAKYAPLQMKLENGAELTLYNTEYQRSCKGCGARGYKGNDAEGVELSYPITEAALALLLDAHVARLKFTDGNGTYNRPVKENEAQTLMEELDLVYAANNPNINIYRHEMGYW